MNAVTLQDLYKIYLPSSPQSTGTNDVRTKRTRVLCGVVGGIPGASIVAVQSAIFAADMSLSVCFNYCLTPTCATGVFTCPMRRTRKGPSTASFLSIIGYLFHGSFHSFPSLKDMSPPTDFSPCARFVPHCRMSALAWWFDTYRDRHIKLPTWEKGTVSLIYIGPCLPYQVPHCE